MAKLRRLLCGLFGHDYRFAGTMQICGRKYRCFICKTCGKRETAMYTGKVK